MALVMLPCELPWWTSLQRHLKHLLLASSTQKLIDGMMKIHEMCNISLDPEEDEKDPDLMKGFAEFLENDFTDSERTHFMDHTLPSIIHRALQLKHWKPSGGLMFSLQQQPDLTELSYDFISSLLAHAFFSTYPKRTLKTHPTLQDFNFTYFFKNLHRPCQKAKLKSILYYFDWLEKNSNEGSIKISRQVMNSKQWLTIEDWLECSLPLCRIQIKHEGKMERSNVDGMEVCFSNSRLGGTVLSSGCTQESIAMCTIPDILVTLLSVEALEDNEIVRIEGVRRFSNIFDVKQKCRLDVIDKPKTVSVCCMDPENYSILPVGQYEEDNVLRELNKCLLGFQQKPLKPQENHIRNQERRLSPIGESFGHTPPEVEATVFIKQTSASTSANSFSSRSPSPDAYCAATINLNDPSMEITKRKCYLSPEMNTLNNRRGRFIVLGSSGECLPVKRPTIESCDSLYSSCNSSFEEFHSANTSVDEESDDEGNKVKKYSGELNTAERRASFAQRLRDALRREMESSLTDSMSTDSSSYAVGISVAGSGLQDGDIRLRRGGSGGFVLAEDSLDEDFLKDSLQQEQEWISRFRTRRSPGLYRKNTNDSSKYSFSTEYSSELEEVYEQFSQWLDDPIMDNGPEKKKGRDLDSRDMAVVRFASALLKRTLSESFAGVPLTDDLENRVVNRNKLVMSVRSLSLELARHKHKLAAQLSLQLPAINDAEIQNIGDNIPCDKKNNCKVTEEEGVNDNYIMFHLNGKGHHENAQSDKNKLLQVPTEVTISRRSSTKSRQSTKSDGKPKKHKNKLAWVIDCITEVIEQTVECEPITLKIQKSQLSQLANKTVSGSCLKPIITGNWGCGSSKKADPQLKFVIQWLAASVAGAPSLVYYTSGNSQLFKMDTLFRVLMDRKWTVGQLATATLRFAYQTLNEPHVIQDNNTLFDELIGIDKYGNGH